MNDETPRRRPNGPPASYAVCLLVIVTLPITLAVGFGTLGTPLGVAPALLLLIGTVVGLLILNQRP